MTRTIQTILFQGVNFGLQVAFVMAAASLLGPAGQGAYALVRTSVFLTESLMWLGLSSSVTYFIAKDFARTHGPLLKLSVLYVGGVLVLGLAACPALLWWAPSQKAGAAMWLASAGWVASLAMVFFFQKVFVGQQRMGAYNLTAVVNSLAAMALLGLLAWAGRLTLVSVVLCHVAANLAALAAALWCHRSFLRRSDFSVPLPRALLSEFFQVGIKGYLSTIAYLLLFRLDFYLVGYFLGPVVLGVYSVAVFVIEAVQKVPDWLGLMLTPRITQSPGQEKALAWKYMTAILAYGAGAAALSVVMVKWAGFPERFLGAGYAAAGPVILALLPRAFLHGVKTVFASRLAGHGYTAYHPASGVAALAVLVAVDLAFIRAHGLTAAVWGITLSYVVSTAVLMVGCRKLVSSPAPAGAPGDAAGVTL